MQCLSGLGEAQQLCDRMKNLQSPICHAFKPLNILPGGLVVPPQKFLDAIKFIDQGGNNT
jgi:hypothetical protein